VYHCGQDIATSSTNNAPFISSASFSLVLDSGLGSSSEYLREELPVVLGSTISSVLGELRSLIDGLHDGLVLGIEGDSLDDVVHLVPHLGSSEVVIGRDGGFASSSGDAVQLLLISTGVKQEAHAPSHVSLAQLGVSS